MGIAFKHLGDIIFCAFPLFFADNNYCVAALGLFISGWSRHKHHAKVVSHGFADNLTTGRVEESFLGNFSANEHEKPRLL